MTAGVQEEHTAQEMLQDGPQPETPARSEVGGLAWWWGETFEKDRDEH